VFTSDQTKPQMAVIDTATNTVKTWVPLDGLATAAGDAGWALLADADTGREQGGRGDLATMKMARRYVGANPQEVLVRPDGKAAYVSCWT